MSNIAVSVIVPVYNTEKYLVKCLESVVNQTLKNIEIIIIDDGSTDNSSQIAQEYAKKDSRIIYYKKENEGLAAARQDGMERAKGEYIGFVDSDDWLELHMYERMYERAKQYDADVVFCNCYEDETVENQIYLSTGVYTRKDIEEKILTRTLAGLTEKGANSVIRWSNCLRLYKAKLIRDNDISFDRRFRRSQDLQLTFETTACANMYVSLNDEYLYHNRNANNGNSLSRGYTENYWKLIRPLIERLYVDVKLYNQQTLMGNMNLCAFFFSVSGVENECKKSKYPFKQKIKKLEEIVKDDIIQNAINSINEKQLNAYYRMVLKGLKTKNSKKMMFIYKLFPIKQGVKNKIVRPVIHFVLSNKVVEKVYIAFRKRVDKAYVPKK